MVLNNILKSHYEIYRSNQTMASEDKSLAKAILESEGVFANFYYSARLTALDLDNIIRGRSNNNLDLDEVLQHFDG